MLTNTIAYKISIKNSISNGCSRFLVTYAERSDENLMAFQPKNAEVKRKN